MLASRVAFARAQNEGYPGQNIRVDVLVSELNFGAASRWFKAGELLPELESD
jgi:hypothetical protein